MYGGALKRTSMCLYIHGCISLIDATFNSDNVAHASDFTPAKGDGDAKSQACKVRTLYYIHSKIVNFGGDWERLHQFSCSSVLV